MTIEDCFGSSYPHRSCHQTERDCLSCALALVKYFNGSIHPLNGQIIDSRGMRSPLSWCACSRVRTKCKRIEGRVRVTKAEVFTFETLRLAFSYASEVRCGSAITFAIQEADGSGRSFDFATPRGLNLRLNTSNSYLEPSSMQDFFLSRSTYGPAVMCFDYRVNL